ncbi:MAG: ABC transporter substrate-binding protein [Deltaproteobacteria bacterium]|nr:ABC transporter substrate-binding protein [Deltaproteobacteria bacterium]
MMVWLRLGFVLTLAVSFVNGAAAQNRVLLGYSSLSSNQTPIWVAKEGGLFKRFGVDVDLILIEGGTRGAQALISGDLPMMGMAGQAVISSRARGGDLVVVGGVVNKMNYIFVGSPSVKSPQDLKGKRIGISQIGTASYHAVVLALKQWKLDARRDGITILQVGSQAARVSSMNSGGTDAIIVNPGLNVAMKQRGYNIIADFSELPIPYPLQVMATRERFLKTEPDLAERLLKAVVAANTFTIDPKNKPRVKAAIAKYLRLPGIDAAEEQYKSGLAVLPKKPYVDVAGISAMIEFLAESDPSVAKIKPEQVINHTIMKKLDDTGFIEHPFAK